jgi:histidinol dehydrogenase
MLSVLAHDDPALGRRLGDVHSRLEALRQEAEPGAREFYRRTLGEDLGIEAVIARIFTDIGRDGDAAVRRYAAAFDGVVPTLVPIAAERCRLAWEGIPAALRAAIATSIDRVTAYQRRLLPTGFGTDLTEAWGARWTPLARVGAYVPSGAGGSLPLISSVVMNLVPAKVAGVGELVMVTPPGPDGVVDPGLLAAAHAVGGVTVYALGGIPAIAALACGTGSIAKVDKIVGPGNLFTTLAKRYAYGRVDIDMLAGPSEVLVLSDGGTDPTWIAADLLSQAEHDVLTMSVLVTIAAPAHQRAVLAALADQTAALPPARRSVATASLARHGLAVDCPDLATAIALADRIAPEHLELLVRDPRPIVPRLRHAGAIFVGPWSPEPIGDYLAGPSHTLPTGGSARIWSGIGADTFLRRTSLISFREEDFRATVDAAVTLARAEGLEAHARSLLIRGRHGATG